MKSDKGHRLRVRVDQQAAAPRTKAPASARELAVAEGALPASLEPGQPPEEHWRSVLGAQSPREALARLLQGDPLGLRRRVAERLAERAYLFDADRVHLRSLAHCARYALRYRGTPPIQAWLTEIIDQAVLDLLREDAEAERKGAPAAVDELCVFVDLARPLGLEPAAMRRVCLAHNLLREGERQAFHSLVILGHGLEETARSLSISGVEVARRARRGLEAVLIAAGQLPESAASSVTLEPATHPGEELADAADPSPQGPVDQVAKEAAQ